MPEYTIADDVLSAHLSGEAVLLDVGTKRYFQLNATGACIWRGLEQGLGRGQIVDELCAHFDVARPEAEEALARHVAELRQQDLIRPAGSEPSATETE
ncbi:MAG: PqqD family protein [Gemmatimonadota bacterium]|nr:PqqD family protein [Gemmatimonadota bacterium]